MADPTYGPKVYKTGGGDTLVIADGGQVLVNDVDVTANLAALAAVPAADEEDSETIWNDNGVLKVSSSG